MITCLQVYHDLFIYWIGDLCLNQEYFIYTCNNGGAEKPARACYMYIGYCEGVSSCYQIENLAELGTKPHKVTVVSNVDQKCEGET